MAAAAQCTALATSHGWQVQTPLITLLAGLSEEQAAQLLLVLQGIVATAPGKAAATGEENPHLPLVQEAFLTLPNVACLEPRGRWDLLFTPSALLFRNKKGVVNAVGARGI